jgi:hypothetical protein
MKKIFIYISKTKIFDLLYSLLIILPAYIFLTYRLIGSSRLPRTTKILRLIGVFPIRNHYYEPLFDNKLLNTPLNSERLLPGINLNEMNQIDLLKKLHYADEFKLLIENPLPNTTENFRFENGSFESGDAEFLYQFLRHLKPKKVIEIGSGNSTKIAIHALKRNFLENGESYQHICIEPYEQPWLESLSNINIIRSKVEDVDIDWASALSSGDMLFIDSSHMIRPQGDVLKEYLEILPSLNSNVFIHIHDIFTPRDYLNSWLVDDVRFWNEQYLLEALLSSGTRYKVIASLNWLKHKYFLDLKKVCPYLTKEREPGSFYIKTQ